MPAAEYAQPPLVVVAVSTGGPDALATLLAASGPVPGPVVIAQHMPRSLAEELAGQLQRRAGWPVRVAGNGTLLVPGEASLLPTDAVLVRVRDAFALRFTPTNAPVHPSADLLFRSAALLGLPACGVVLTGMGEDGAAGALALARVGGRILVQTGASSVVGGMPQAARVRIPAAEALAPEAIGLRLRHIWETV